MATPSARPGPNGASSTGSTPSRTRDLGGLRSGEPGSAFRGLVKGRGTERGGGRGGGRGGRGGRTASRGGRSGGAQVNGTKPDSGVSKDGVSAAEQPSPTTGPSNSTTEKTSAPSPNTTERAPRPKGNSRRNVPALVIEPSSPNSEAPTATLPSPSNRRRPSRQHKKSPASAGPSRQSLVVETNQTLLSPLRAHTGPPSPITPFRDAPPHSSAPETTTFDMKHSIDALVERVRAVAMDSNRPTTPGSHIDWAGDEDDSLPDLDDWGVTTSTSVAGDKNKIPPIPVDGLKPLPETLGSLNGSQEGTKKSDTPVNPVVVVSKVADKVPAPDEKGASKRTIPTRAPRRDSKTEIVSKPINPTSKTAAYQPPATEPMAVLPSLPSGLPAGSPETSRVPLHPSLPAKPVAAVESLLAQSKPRPNAAPVRVSPPAKQPVMEKPSAPVESAVTTVEVTSASEQPSIAVVKLPSSPPLAAEISLQPMSAPSDADLSLEDITHKLGLSASIHAPSSMPSLPSLSQSTPTGPPAFNPTHQRAHTVGRPHGHQSQPPQTFHSHFSRSGLSTPRGGFGPDMRHGRTHSSPPVGSALNPRIHSRPVITGAAISQLARRIEGSTPARAKAVSTAKE